MRILRNVSTVHTDPNLARPLHCTALQTQRLFLFSFFFGESFPAYSRVRPPLSPRAVSAAGGAPGTPRPDERHDPDQTMQPVRLRARAGGAGARVGGYVLAGEVWRGCWATLGQPRQPPPFRQAPPGRLQGGNGELFSSAGDISIAGLKEEREGGVESAQVGPPAGMSGSGEGFQRSQRARR